MAAWSPPSNDAARGPAELLEESPSQKADPKLIATAEQIIEPLEGPSDPTQITDR